MVRLCGAALGFFAFSITIFLGLAAGNSVEVILHRAIRAMLLFLALGLAVGYIARRVVEEYSLQRQKELLEEGEGDPQAGESSPTGSSAEAAAIAE